MLVIVSFCKIHLFINNAIVLLLFYTLVGCEAQLNRTKIEKTLIKALFEDYDPEGRPVLNLSQPVLVKFGLAYSNLHSLVSI